jgi:hypothetical protein
MDDPGIFRFTWGKTQKPYSETNDIVEEASSWQYPHMQGRELVSVLAVFVI